jgi:hypothetical protein
MLINAAVFSGQLQVRDTQRQMLMLVMHGGDWRNHPYEARFGRNAPITIVGRLMGNITNIGRVPMQQGVSPSPMRAPSLHALRFYRRRARRFQPRRC